MLQVAQLASLQNLQFDPSLMAFPGAAADLAPLTALTQLSALALRPAPPVDMERVRPCLHLECLTQLVRFFEHSTCI